MVCSLRPRKLWDDIKANETKADGIKLERTANGIVVTLFKTDNRGMPSSLPRSPLSPIREKMEIASQLMKSKPTPTRMNALWTEFPIRPYRPLSIIVVCPPYLPSSPPSFHPSRPPSIIRAHSDEISTNRYHSNDCAARRAKAKAGWQGVLVLDARRDMRQSQAHPSWNC